MAAVTTLRAISNDKNICFKSEIRLSYAFDLLSLSPYMWIFDIIKEIQALEMRYFRTILGISYVDRIRNDEMHNTISQEIYPSENYIPTVKKRNLK